MKELIKAIMACTKLNLTSSISRWIEVYKIFPWWDTVRIFSIMHICTITHHIHWFYLKVNHAACLRLGTTPHGKYAVLFGCSGFGVWIPRLHGSSEPYGWRKNGACPVGHRVGACPGCMRPHSMALPAALEAETKIFIFWGCLGKKNII